MENTIKKPINNDFNLDVKKEEKRSKVVKITTKTITYIFLTIVAITAFLPFYWMIISSLKNETEFRASVPTFFPQTGIAWQNYQIVVTADDSLFITTLTNTLLVGILSTGLGVIVTILTAYAFAKLEFKGKNLLFSLMMATMMIPGELFTITNVLTVGRGKDVFQIGSFGIDGFGWNGTYIVLILPLLVSFYYIYLLRNAFMQIPNSLYQAAKVDGCSEMGYLVKVMVPLTAPTLISITLLKLIGTWNSYIWPRLVNKTDERMLLISNWVTNGFEDINHLVNPAAVSGSLSTLKMAAACMVTLPLFVLFICFRKYIMQGVSKSGTKG